MVAAATTVGAAVTRMVETTRAAAAPLGAAITVGAAIHSTGAAAVSTTIPALPRARSMAITTPRAASANRTASPACAPAPLAATIMADNHAASPLAAVAASAADSTVAEDTAAAGATAEVAVTVIAKRMKRVIQTEERDLSSV